MFQLIRSKFNLNIESLKMVLVVRDDLKMSKGKTAAQCSHAAVMCYEKSLKKNPELLKKWCAMGQPKIVVKAPGVDELQKIYRNAIDANMIVAAVRDAGRTQVATGTLTVIGLGPDLVKNIDAIACHLKLL